MAILFTELGVVIGLFVLFIVYKILLCPEKPSNVQCDWQDARVVIIWSSQSRTDRYQIRYRKKE